MVGRLQLARAWLRSAAHRRAFEIWRQRRRTWRARCDVLPEATAAELQNALAELRGLLAPETPEGDLDRAGNRVEALAAEWLKPPRWPRLREGIEVFFIIVLLVVVTRTFFVMPSAIPTGSMEPTLYGVNVIDRRADDSFRMPGRVEALVERFVFGRQYFQVVARADGRLEAVEPPAPRWRWLPLPWGRRQRFKVGDEWYVIPEPMVQMPDPRPDEAADEVFLRLARVDPQHRYRRGEIILQAVLESGDRLLVDRMTYHFRRPRRGEIVVFQPHGVDELDDDTFYLKRIVACSGERIRLGDDGRAWIDGEPISDRLPGFRKIYGAEGPGGPGRYSGHLNERLARRYGPSGRGVAPFFKNGRVERLVPEGTVVLLGDNTLESSDSRQWGPVAERDIVGRVGCVYWPWSPRIGRGFE